MNYEKFLELAKNRRSIRRFKPGDIPGEYIDKIIEAGRWAPSGYNLQPWEFVVVRDASLKNSIVQLIKEESPLSAKMEIAREKWQGKPLHRPQSGPVLDDFSLAPVFIIVLGDSRVNIGLPMLRRYNYELKQQAYLSGLASATLLMHLAATSLGLGSQWVSGVAWPYVHCSLKPLLGIPHYMDVYDMMAVGYPGYKARGKLVREKEKMIHRDYCGENEFRTEEEVRDFIRRDRIWSAATSRRKVDK